MLSLRKSTHLIHHTEEEVYTVLFQLSVFACMLVVTTLLVLSTHDTYMYQFDSTICRIFLQRKVNNGPDFENLVTIAEWYDYIDEIFLKYWSNQYVAVDTEGQLIKTPVFLRENFHIGVARFRQMRVKPYTCIIHDTFNRYFNSCFVRYSESAEDNQQNYKGYRFFKNENFPVSKVEGVFNKYKGPGYVVFLTHNSDDNTEWVGSLRKLKWIDRATRLVLIEFVLYNSNLNTLINVKLITEVLPTGSLLSSYEVAFLPIHSIWSTKRPSVLIVATIFYTLVVFYTSEEYWFFKIYRFYNYFRNKWNLLDSAILINAYISLVLSVIHPYRINTRLYTMAKNPNGDLFIDDLCYMHNVFKFFLTICAILVWLKIFRFISFNLTMLRFSMAISRSFRDIMGFSIMFFIIFIAYSLLGLLLFSDINPGFSNFSKALVTMMRMIMGDYQYQNIEKADSVLGPMFFISYILFIFFILLNMFLAVISDTYVAVKESVHPHKSSIRAKIIAIWYKITRACTWCCKRRKSKASVIFFDADHHIPMRDEDPKEVYTSARSSLDSLETEGTLFYTPRPSNYETELTKLVDHAENLEYDLETLIARMDRILQKLDTRFEEEKVAKSLGKI